MIRHAFVIIVGYACAAMVSQHVSMDLTETNWATLWTYFWWVMAAPILFMIWAIVAVMAIAWMSK